VTEQVGGIRAFLLPRPATLLLARIPGSNVLSAPHSPCLFSHATFGKLGQQAWRRIGRCTEDAHCWDDHFVDDALTLRPLLMEGKAAVCMQSRDLGSIGGIFIHDVLRMELLNLLNRLMEGRCNTAPDSVATDPNCPGNHAIGKLGVSTLVCGDYRER